MYSYLYNGVNVDTASWGGSAMGGGLLGATGLKDGCKVSQIKNPSQFVTFAEACSKHRNVEKGSTFHKYVYFCLPERRLVGSSSMSYGGLGLGQHSNGKSSNYVFADGHVESIRWNKIRWKIFGIYAIDNKSYSSQYYR